MAIKTYLIISNNIDSEINIWLDKHKSIKLIDIKFNTLPGYGNSFALIIYDDSPMSMDIINPDIKRYIDDSIRESLKDIREIYQDFATYKK